MKFLVFLFAVLGVSSSYSWNCTHDYNTLLTDVSSREACMVRFLSHQISVLESDLLVLYKAELPKSASAGGYAYRVKGIKKNVEELLRY